MAPTRFAAVVAVTKEWGIGNEGNLPWHPRRLHLDMAFLKYVTTHSYGLSPSGSVHFGACAGKNIVVMGRKTWDSIPPRFRPMEGRHNIVITSNPGEFRAANAVSDGIYAVRSFEEAIEKGEELLVANGGQIFVLGGASVYEAALRHDRCEAVFITRLQGHPALPCTVFFPATLLASFPDCSSITADCLEILTPMLGKNAKIEFDEIESIAREGDISYCIEARSRGG